MMKQDLQRIEATLRRLNTAAAPTVAQTAAASTPASVQSSPPSRAKQEVSFEIARSIRSSQTGAKAPTTPTATIQPPPRLTQRIAVAGPTVQPFPVQNSTAQPLSLPKFKLPSFSNHRHSFNSELPLSLAREITLTIERWQSELRQVIRQIQDLYAEGPIVNGWLEQEKDTSSASTQVDLDTAILRHAEGEELLRYVEKICEPSPGGKPADDNTPDTVDGSNDNPADYSKANVAASTTHTAFSPDSKYQLCGLDADGRLWCRPCPPDQLPTVSMAIARYRKLRVLLNRKEQLEVHLRHAAEALVEVQSYLQRMVQPV